RSMQRRPNGKFISTGVLSTPNLIVFASGRLELTHRLRSIHDIAWLRATIKSARQLCCTERTSPPA
ncbi:MAG: hypothetical protein ACI8W7_002732, partial [Gammaproteobacteria bacterium]